MSIDVNESISSLVDGELDVMERRRVLDTLKQEIEHQDTWGRYCLISQALKRDLPTSPNNDLFCRIQSAIELEPALLSPSPSTLNDETKTAEVVELPRKSEATPTKNSKSFVGLATAASFALVAVVGFQFLSTNNNINPGVPIASTQTIAPTQEIQIVTRSTSGPTTVSTNNEEPLYAEQSVINDGQWTRITHIGNLSLNGRLVGQPIESHANVVIRGNAIPFAQTVNVDEAASK